MKQITMYTDGSCLGNPGPGGWAAILRLDGTDTRKELCGGARLTTNNRMEMLSVIMALEALKEPCQVQLHTDSRYVCDAVNRGWLQGWRRRGWIKADRKPVKNVDLWERMLPLLERHQVEFHWLRGHAGHPENERCDELARTCAARPDLPEDGGFTPDSVEEEAPAAKRKGTAASAKAATPQPDDAPAGGAARGATRTSGTRKSAQAAPVPADAVGLAGGAAAPAPGVNLAKSDTPADSGSEKRRTGAGAAPSGDAGQELTIHLAECCPSSPGPGGWAAVVRGGRGGTYREICGGRRMTTPQRLALTATARALESLGATRTSVVVVTDRPDFAEAAKRRGGRGDEELWEDLLPLLERHDVSFRLLPEGAGGDGRCREMAEFWAAQPGLPR